MVAAVFEFVEIRSLLDQNPRTTTPPESNSLTADPEKTSPFPTRPFQKQSPEIQAEGSSAVEDPRQGAPEADPKRHEMGGGVHDEPLPRDKKGEGMQFKYSNHIVDDIKPALPIHNSHSLGSLRSRRIYILSRSIYDPY